MKLTIQNEAHQVGSGAAAKPAQQNRTNDAPPGIEQSR